MNPKTKLCFKQLSFVLLQYLQHNCFCVVLAANPSRLRSRCFEGKQVFPRQKYCGFVPINRKGRQIDFLDDDDPLNVTSVYRPFIFTPKMWQQIEVTSERNRIIVSIKGLRHFIANVPLIWLSDSLPWRYPGSLIVLRFYAARGWCGIKRTKFPSNILCNWKMCSIMGEESKISRFAGSD